MLVHDHRAEADFAFGDAFVRTGYLVQRVGFGEDLHLASCRIVQGLLEILAPVLLRADDLDPAHDEITRRHGQRLGRKPHDDEAPVGLPRETHALARCPKPTFAERVFTLGLDAQTRKFSAPSAYPAYINDIHRFTGTIAPRNMNCSDLP